MKKIILTIALLAVVVFAGAQTAALHGYMDYTNMAVGQEFKKAAGATDWTKTEAAAEFGSFYNGRTEVNAVVDAANFQFNLGIRMNASLQTWYNLYRSTDGASALVDTETLNDGIATFFHQGNMRVSFWNDQLRVYTGKFEEWNNGYIYGGYVLGGQSVSDLAMRDLGQHFTGVEVSPYALNGFRMMVGFPILPVSGNGVNYAEHNQWKNLWKKVKIMGSYKLPVGITVNFGVRPETHYDGTDRYSAESLYGEAFVQGDFPYLIPEIPFNATYDFRWRKEAANDKFATAHYFGLSGKLPQMGNLSLSLENRFAYASDHYIAINEELIYDIFGIAATYAIPNSDYFAGLNLFAMYGQDARGTGFSGEGRVASKYCVDYSMDWDWMPFADKPAAGTPGRYLGIYAYPYIQKNFANGYFKTGVEVQYTRFATTNVTQAIGYRVPVALCFWY